MLAPAMGEIGGMVAGWLEAEFHDYMRHKSELNLESKVTRV